eukprot:6176515-Pleurochrysis_carterae.AAC.3
MTKSRARRVGERTRRIKDGDQGKLTWMARRGRSYVVYARAIWFRVCGQVTTPSMKREKVVAVGLSSDRVIECKSQYTSRVNIREAEEGAERAETSAHEQNLRALPERVGVKLVRVSAVPAHRYRRFRPHRRHQTPVPK